MASAVKRIYSQRLIKACTRPICPVTRPRQAQQQWQRPFSSTLLLARERSNPNNIQRSLPADVDLSDPNEFEDIRPLEWVEDDKKIIEEEEPVDRSKLGYWAEGEPDMGPDEEFYGDDMSSLGHGELERHREMRQYARLAAWELPLLANLSKPFELPQKTQPLRFRYTTYLGEEHPAAHKVVLEFCPSDLPNVTPEQQAKLIKICGPRYNPSTEIVKMSCELFDTQMQNKRFLSDVVNSLIKEAKDPKDTFADVPFDFRHHKPKQRFEFPKEWLLTPERKKELQMRRNQSLDEDNRRIQAGGLIDGGATIESFLGVAKEVEPELVMAQAGQRQPARRR